VLHLKKPASSRRVYEEEEKRKKKMKNIERGKRWVAASSINLTPVVYRI
jgi:hypothetical protein